MFSDHDVTVAFMYLDIELVKQELLQAIAYFIERQFLVAQAITDFGLSTTAIGTYGASAWAWNPHQSIAALCQELETVTRPELYARCLVGIRAHERCVPQQGIWHDQQGHVWSYYYYFHGMGCQITHMRTQEVIDWDCPNLTAFDPFFFEAHLGWQLTSEHLAYQLTQVRVWVAQNGIHAIQHLIEQLVDSGAITPDMSLA